jgi:hypothetical protein
MDTAVEDKNQIPPAVFESLKSSGFPFQTAIARIIADTQPYHIETEEFPWQDHTGKDQFVDLIASNEAWTLVIECKKTRKENLTFLKPDAHSSDRHWIMRCVFTTQVQDLTPHFDLNYGDWSVRPLSHESTYCVVSTSEKGTDQRLLERDARQLVRASDAYADATRNSRRPPQHFMNLRPYIPLIVTNARLFVATYHPREISLDTGQFSADPANVVSVPWVRFRKAFTSEPGGDYGGRSVLIVNADSLKQLLGVLDVGDWTPRQIQPAAQRRG